MPKIFNRSVLIAGETFVIGGVTVTVKEFNVNDHVTFCDGATLPADGQAGFAKGCRFIKTSTSATVGATEYINEGTGSSCDFNLLSGGVAVQSKETTVATTSNTDVYIIAPATGNLSSLIFSGHDALTANDTNFITFSATNLGQAGAGATAMLAATDANTTKATGGTALAADTFRTLTLNGTAANLAVTKGDRIRVRMAASGTLANTVTLSSVLANFN